MTKLKNVMRAGTVAAAAAIALVALPAGASAGTYSNSYSGSEASTDAVALTYSAGHASSVLRLNVNGSATEEGFGINMYDRNGARVYSAGVRGTTTVVGAVDQYFSIGGNVTRVVVDPYAWWAQVKWSRA
ncbi:hypothetical protein R3P93_23195 [Rhodococcus cerastii]|uniref:Uncharacterized protein n=1 Tax=Rhodococcus cerastii TaxID=908616 RepID=A0ABU4D6Y9_9NOCA|nr:hypothetical protein [Rhodococcus cerastii]MDV6305482.1 hypothetical protein [Rhodococcus cerastii]